MTMVSLVLMGLAACSGTGANSGSASSSASPSADLTALPDIKADAGLSAKVPQPFRDAGIVVASSPDTPPMTYFADDNTTMIGFDVDMSRAIGEVLGVKTKVQEAGFDSIIPGLAANRYSMALSSMGVTAARQKTVDMVSYYEGGQGFLASNKSSYAVTKLEDLCGKRVAVGAGTVQQTTLADGADMCKKAGLQDFVLQPYPDLNQATLAVKSDRADVLYASISIVGYTAKNAQGFRIAGVYKRATVGAALPKNSALTPLVQAAVQRLIDDGTYQQILKKWGLDDNAIKTAEINSAK